MNISILNNICIFDIDSEAIVNPVNTFGVMGKGLALEFKKKYPKNNEIYQKECLNFKLTVGNILVVQENNKYILNFPTKDHWKNLSKYSYIETGMNRLVEITYEFPFISMAIPALGCDLGGLEWNTVKDIILNKCEQMKENLNIFIIEPI